MAFILCFKQECSPTDKTKLVKNELRHSNNISTVCKTIRTDSNHYSNCPDIQILTK